MKKARPAKASPSRPATKKEMALIHDLGRHTSQRVHTAISDTVDLIEDKTLAYTVVLSVLSSITCSLAKMHGGKHSKAVETVLLNLTEMMAAHLDHGEDD